MKYSQSIGSLNAQSFLKKYWQKKALFLPNALPDFKNLITKDELITLACRDDVQSRLVIQEDGRWQVLHGPFKKRDFQKLKQNNWSLLVQNVNHYSFEAHQLLMRFNFIPYTRLDDLMISYAPSGGSVGAHYDSYDVFLLQGSGKRRWQISNQPDLRLIENAPLKLLKDFFPRQEWITSLGDLLYLPPNWAHYGVALDACITYSVGFRAPSVQELATSFLNYLGENIELGGWYRDPNLQASQEPARITEDMFNQVFSLLKNIRWEKTDVLQFLGRSFSEPKAHVFFNGPTKPMSESLFAKRLATSSINLDLKSLMLFDEDHIYLNGEVYRLRKAPYRALCKLANARRLSPPIVPQLHNLLYQWYRAGYIQMGD